jgi:catechol-2,3-dioxygenase
MGYQGDNMNLPVPDLEVALPFYETVLSFRVLSRSDRATNRERTPHRRSIHSGVKPSPARLRASVWHCPALLDNAELGARPERRHL